MRGMKLGRGTGRGLGRGTGLKDGSGLGWKTGGRGLNKTDVCRHPKYKTELSEDSKEAKEVGKNVAKNMLGK